MFNEKIKKVEFSYLRKIFHHKKKKKNLEKTEMIDNDDVLIPITMQLNDDWDTQKFKKDFSSFNESNNSIQDLLDNISLNWDDWFNDNKKLQKPKNTKCENNFSTNITKLKNRKEVKKYLMQTIIIAGFTGVICYLLLHLYLCQSIC